MDWFAVASRGSYPTPTPTGAARAAYAVSYGLLDGSTLLITTGGRHRGFIRVRRRRKR